MGLGKSKVSNVRLHSSAGSARSCGPASSKLQFAFVTSVFVFCPLVLNYSWAGDITVSGCHNVLNMPYSMARVRQSPWCEVIMRKFSMKRGSRYMDVELPR